MIPSGEDLYQLVVEYAALGEHRTGTAVDRATGEWLASHLRDAGGRVEMQQFEFDRYNATWQVQIDGETVPSIPLFYEGTGTVSTNQPATMVWSPGLANTGEDSAFADFVHQALLDGNLASVVATSSSAGLLHAVNRRVTVGSGLPTLLVPGAYADRLNTAEISVEIDASIVRGSSNNVIARFGAGPLEDTLVITTPISGWFQCAGERGTGIAVALYTLQQLAERVPVLFLGTSGHELHHLGAQRVLRDLAGTPKAIAHIGASVAASESLPVDGHAGLTKSLRARLAAEPQQVVAIQSQLSEIGVQASTPSNPLDANEWIGEAKNWAHFGQPMLSLAGHSWLFHAPEDTPDRATTPRLLERSASAISNAIVSLAGD